MLALIKTDPANVSLESMLTEIDKLLAVRAVGVPAEVFADVAPRVLAGAGGRDIVGHLEDGHDIRLPERQPP